MPRSPQSTARNKWVPLALIAGDTVMTFAGLSLGYWLRYDSAIGRLGIDVPNATFRLYLPLILAGVALLLGAFAQFGLYDGRFLLRRYQSLNVILKGTGFWLVAYLCISLVLEFDPPISRLFVVIGFVCVIALLFAWRTLAYLIVAKSRLLDSLRRRTLLLGWNDATRDIALTVASDRMHPLAIDGFLLLPGEPRPAESSVPCLGSISEIDALLAERDVSLVIATRMDLPRELLRHCVESCERAYVEWKVVPGAFDIFLSGLRLQTIGRVPVLGVEDLPINRLFSRTLKRAIDVAGSLIGLLIGTPVMLVLAILIRRESPRGSVLFRQTRVGVGHKTFTLYKLRSMTPEASFSDDTHQSTRTDDPRLLGIGGFIRRWNLDELPQFWNVLKGEMSLVGPRPERPYHVEQLAEAIPHYLPRHLVKPGMTGWAQINGLRGAGDLHARIQHDIYYIENWSLWLDAQIIALTFVRWKDEPRPA